MAEGRLPEAIPVLRRAVELNPHDAPAVRMLAAAEKAVGTRESTAAD